MKLDLNVADRESSSDRQFNAEVESPDSGAQRQKRDGT